MSHWGRHARRVTASQLVVCLILTSHDQAANVHATLPKDTVLRHSPNYKAYCRLTHATLLKTNLVRPVRECEALLSHYRKQKVEKITVTSHF